MDNFYAVYIGASHGNAGVTSLNGLNGALTLVGGPGITVTPAGNTITISATGVGMPLTQNHIFVGNASNSAQDVPMTGDVNIVFSAGNGATSLVATTNSTLTTLSALSLPTTQLTGTLQAAQEPAHTGDVTNSAGSLALSLVATTNSTLTSLPSLVLPASQISGVLPIAHGGTNSGTALNNNRIMISSGGAIVENAALTQNQVVFPNSSGLPTGSSAFTFVTNILTVFSGLTNSNSRGFVSQNGAAGIFGGMFIGKQSRGSNASPTATQSGDHLVDLLGEGYGATAFNSNSGKLSFLAAENFTDTANGTRFIVATTPTGSITSAPGLEVAPDQGLILYNADGTFIKHKTPASSANYTLTWPAAQAVGTKLLQNDGAGNLSWAAGGASLSSLTAATATNTIDNLNFSQVWNWSTNTGDGMTIANTFNDVTSTGNALSVLATGGNNSSVALNVNHSGHNAGVGAGVKITTAANGSSPPALVISAGAAGIALTQTTGSGATMISASTTSNAGVTGIQSYLQASTTASQSIYGINSSSDIAAHAGRFQLDNGSPSGSAIYGQAKGPALVADLEGETNTGSRDILRLYNSSTATNDNSANIVFANKRNTTGLTQVASIGGAITDVTNGAYKGALTFAVANNAGPVEAMRIQYDGSLLFPTAIDLSGSPIINKISGRVQINNLASSVTVTNSLVTTNSIVFAVIQTAGAAVIQSVVPGSGSFTINATAAVTGNQQVSFWVINQ